MQLFQMPEGLLTFIQSALLSYVTLYYDCLCTIVSHIQVTIRWEMACVVEVYAV